MAKAPTKDKPPAKAEDIPARKDKDFEARLRAR